MKYLFLCILFFPFVSSAELTSKQIIAQKVAFIAYHTGVDENLAVEIFTCESGLAQIRSHKVNKNGTRDWGVGQINDIHMKEAKKLGMDVRYNVDDNIRFALRLIKQDGAYRHYKASSKCWLPKVALHATPYRDV